MGNRAGWRQPSVVVSGCAGVLSMLSLCVSSRSCVVANRSLDLAKAEFRSQRSLVLGGEVDSDGNSIKIKAIDPAVVLQEARAVFPTAVEKQEWPILPPDHRLYALMLRVGLEKAIQERIGRTPGFVSVSSDASVPVVITSLYTAKGELFVERALYRIVYGFVVDGDSPTPPKVEFKGLIYTQRMDPKVDPVPFLDKLWQQTTWKK
jgi:hypothetical protein